MIDGSGAPRLGVDLGGTKIEVVALDSRGRELLRRRVATPRGDYAATIDAIARLIDDAGREIGLRDRVPVGIGTPGTYSRATGLMRNCNSVWLNGRALKRDLEARLQRRIALANDANCFALSEAIDGAAAGARTVFGVILGTGVGGGLVVDGTVLDGPNGIAGEWGHNPLPWPEGDERPGPACYCGRSGCVETFLSGPGMARDHMAAGGASLAPEAIVAAAATGNAACVATLDRYEQRLARGLAHVINIFDPEVVVLGGGMSNIGALAERVQASWHRFVFSDRVDTRLVQAMHGDSSGVRGAAWLASAIS